jgi:glycosyltransferase involved in cell wall biosynthesis
LEGRLPRRILFLDHTGALGGGEIALLNLVTHLDASRYQPVVVLFADGPLRGRLAAAGVESHVLPLDPGVGDARKDALGLPSILQVRRAVTAAAFCVRLAALLRRLRGDLVHANSLKSDVLGGVAARLAGLPVVWHVRDRIADDYLPRPVAAAFRALARALPDHVIANSAATRATLVGTGPAAGRRRSAACCTVVHDGTVLPPAGPPAAGGGWAAGGPRVGLVGRIAPWKGQDVFLRAAAEVRRRFPAARFLVVGGALFGEADFERRVRSLAAELGLGDAVAFTGFRADAAALIAGLDVLVHASVVGEPFGQVIIEGMAAGKPVVATRGGGVPEIVADGETGLLVPMGDAAAMAAAVARLLADPAAAREMGRRGRRRAAERFAIAGTARGVERVLDRLGAARPPRAAPPPPPRAAGVVRVLHVGHSAAPGGGELALLRALRHMDPSRFASEVCLFEDGPLVGLLAAAGVATHVSAVPRAVVHARRDGLGPAALALGLDDAVATLGRALGLARLIVARRFDVVHTTTLKAHLIGGLAARAAGCGLAWGVHNRLEDDYLPRAAVRALRGLCGWLPDVLVANSAATLATLRLADPRRGVVAYPGVEVRPADPGPPPGPRPPTVGVVGRLSPFKGQDVFLRAAAAVARRHPDARFRVVGGALFGEQAYERRLRRLADELGVAGRVEFAGHRPDVGPELCGLDVLVHASVVGEPFGQVVAEGMAWGLPVVATRGGGVPELVEDGVTGVLVPMGDAAAMAAAICRLLDDPPAARAMGRRARAAVEARFDARRTTRDLERAIERAARRPVAGGPPP